VLRIFIALKNPSPCPGFEPATVGSSGQHTNHYTTKLTSTQYQYCRKSMEITEAHVSNVRDDVKGEVSKNLIEATPFDTYKQNNCFHFVLSGH
jgi:hypothetical protein